MLVINPKSLGLVGLHMPANATMPKVCGWKTSDNEGIKTRELYANADIGFFSLEFRYPNGERAQRDF